jgi:hypothetical protein
MAQKSNKGDRKIAKVMKEFKEGDLKSSSGQKVERRDQAIAIALSEAGRSRPAKKAGAGTKAKKRSNGGKPKR